MVWLVASLAGPCGGEQRSDEPTAVEAAGEEAVPETADEERASAIDGSVRWELSAEPTQLTMAQRGTWVIRIAATNVGTEPVNPDQHAGEFELDAQPHHGLNLWFGNGVRSSAWSDLPPGETVTDERTPGEQLFDAPGTYVLSYRHGSALTSVTVAVTP